jgi:hypothetical protein
MLGWRRFLAQRGLLNESVLFGWRAIGSELGGEAVLDQAAFGGPTGGHKAALLLKDQVTQRFGVGFGGEL